MLRNTLVAAMMMAFCGGAGAAGLGRINVISALGQPLRAEVELSATAEELESMVVRLASAEAFKRANIEYMGAFRDVSMAIEKRAGKSVVKIATSRPFNEPFVDLLLDLSWVGGHLQREYTFLLDPVDVSAPRPIAPVSIPVSKSLVSTPAPTPERKPAAQPAKAVVPAGDYTVQRGDTLNKIASEFKSSEVSQDQMLAALYRANTDAFIGGNINRLRAGKILKVPEASVVSGISKREARQIVLKASDFEQYREKVAAAATNAPARESGSGQVSGGKIAPKVEEPAVSAEKGKDKVRVTAAEIGKGGKDVGDKASKARIQALQDDVVAREKALKESKSRISELENNVKELEKLIQLKNQALADAEKRAANAKNASPSAEKLALEQAEAAKAANAKEAELKAAAEAAAASSVAAEEAAKAAAEAEAAKVVPLPDASEPVVEKVEAPAVAEVSAPAVQAPAPAPVMREQAPIEEEGFFGKNLLALLGLGVAAGGLGYVVMKQRRKRAEAGTGNTQLTEASTTTSPNSVFGSAGGQTVDTGGTSLLHTDFSQSGMSAIDADEGVDPVAEADVYMAYGRDAQAEEILLDALKNDPARTAVYLKLLEIYSQRRALKQFENVATDLYTQTAGVGDDWVKAAALGMRLDPNNPLYKVNAAEEEALAEEAPVELDLPIEESGLDVDVEPEKAEAEAVSFGTNNISQVRSTWTVPGDINKFTSAEGDMPMLDVEPEKAAEAPVPESLNLDFNLDLETPAGEDQPTELEAREDAVLEVDESATTTQTGMSTVGAPLEFDIGLDEEEPEARLPAAQRPAAAVAEEFDVGIESSGGAEPLAEVDLEKTNFEGSLLDFDFELGEETNTKPALDLSAMNLGGEEEELAPAAPSLSASVVHEPIQDSIDLNEEVSTKLELAKAYEEMGDVEGARELLEEVISDGAEVQKEQARAMLARLG